MLICSVLCSFALYTFGERVILILGLQQLIKVCPLSAVLGQRLSSWSQAASVYCLVWHYGKPKQLAKRGSTLKIYEEWQTWLQLCWVIIFTSTNCHFVHCLCENMICEMWKTGMSERLIPKNQEDGTLYSSRWENGKESAKHMQKPYRLHILIICGN